jgi:hypothetical protein
MDEDGLLMPDVHAHSIKKGEGGIVGPTKQRVFVRASLRDTFIFYRRKEWVDC